MIKKYIVSYSCTYTRQLFASKYDQKTRKEVNQDKHVQSYSGIESIA